MKSQKEKKPLISICCTTYNLENYIQTTLDGFLCQEGDFSFEIIIHDDASDDATQNILKRYKNNYPNLFHLILQTENQFAQNNVSLGEMYYKYILPKASGKYIALCDGDDYWTDPYKLQRQLNLLESEESHVACFTNALVLNEMDKTKRPYTNKLREGSVPEWNIFIGGGGLYPTSTLFFEKAALYRSKMYRNLLQFISNLEADTSFLFALATEGDVGYINQKTSVYRRWNSGMFSSIKDDKSKLVERTKRQINGLKKLHTYINDHQKPYLKRKISSESLFVLRNGELTSEYKYLLNLHHRDVIKLFTGIR